MSVFRMIIMIYNSLSPNVKLPFKIVQGTVAQRKEKAIKYVDKLYNDLYPKFVHGKVTVNDVQASVDKVIGEKRKVHVLQKPESDYFGGQDVLLSEHTGKISGLTLEFDTGKRYLKMPDIVTVVHEFQHIMDMFLHPKYTARYQYMSGEGLYTPKYDKMYENLFYKRVNPKNRSDKAKMLKKIEYGFKKFIKKVPTYERMNYIQDTRYYLLSEMAAYKTQLKYARLLDKKHQKVLKEDLIDAEKTYFFKEKLKIINRIALETIKKERLRIAKAQKSKANAMAKTKVKDGKVL